MNKNIIFCLLVLFCNNTLAQLSPQFQDSSYKCPAGWDSCSVNSIFSGRSIYYDPAIVKTTCNNQFGIVACKAILKKNGLSLYKNKPSKTIITFSFENFSSCLVFLNYKKFSLASIRQSFRQFKSKYPHAGNKVPVSTKDYLIFQKKYLFYINTLSQSQKNILMEYIAFFENQQTSYD